MKIVVAIIVVVAMVYGFVAYSTFNAASKAITKAVAVHTVVE